MNWNHLLQIQSQYTQKSAMHFGLQYQIDMDVGNYLIINLTLILVYTKNGRDKRYEALMYANWNHNT